MRDTSSHRNDSNTMNTSQRLLLWAAIATALAGVFAAYLQPALVVDLANRFWSCL
ncbi:MAG: hypothetical protein RLZZ584_1243 [Pseudomonadota bacterium]|jgi:hypothetical protein